MDAVDVVGNEQVDQDEILEKIATKPSGKFLWLVQGLLVDYEVFNQHVLERDLKRVERYYHSRGYHHARVRAGRVRKNGDGHVRVEIHVEEGPGTRITRVEIKGVAALDAAERSALLKLLTDTTSQGARFEEASYESAQSEAKRLLADHGYAYAVVEANAFVDIPRSEAQIVYTIRPGNRARFGTVSIKGLQNVPEEPVRDALQLEEGDAYSQASLDEAKQALLDLGVLSSVDISADPKVHPSGANVVPVTVTVTESKTKSVKLGGGVQMDVIQSGAHAIAGWKHRNFFGGLRSFSIEAKPGLVVYPTRLPTFETPEQVLPVARLSGRLVQPGFIEPRSAGSLSADYDIFAVLFLSRGNPDAPIVGYREARTSAALERRFGKLVLRPSFNVQTDVPFAYRGELSDDATAVYILYSELAARLDLRDDSITPTKGAFAALVMQYADFGGDAHDFRIEPEARAYFRVPGLKATLALKGVVGFLFPFNYATYGVGKPLPSVKDTQVSYFRSFFAGGTNSNRGYPFRAVGPHGAVEFFDPTLSSEAANCDPASSDRDADLCAFPLGGRSLWEVSAEFRFKVSGAFSSAFFCDASDVMIEQFTLLFHRPHLSCGTGLRYATPVGPIRFDLGVRIPGLQVIGPLDRIERSPGTLLGLPLNASFGIGEAF